MASETLESLRLTMPSRALSITGGPAKYFKNPPISKKPIIWSTGGLGDCLLSMNLAEAIEEYIGEEVIFYTRYPKIVKWLSDLDARDEAEFIPVGADWWITVNTLVLFNFQNNFKGFKNTKIEEMFLSYRGFLSRGDWQFLINRQPFMENITGIEALKLGLNRQTLGFSILGVPFRPLKKTLPFNTAKVLTEKFITVHDGYDDANDKVQIRSTKNWSLVQWENTVITLRAMYPEIKIVQLGGKTSRKIPGVDYDLVGQTSLEYALEILSKSELHIDTESGLVHAAHMLGVKSIVLFGPTNQEFFAYEDNYNISPKFCGNCWWLKENWMSKCTLGYLAPLCMDSIGHREVVAKAKEYLDERRKTG